MRPKARFIQSVVRSAAAEQVTLPWARGSRRRATLLRRSWAEANAERRFA